MTNATLFLLHLHRQFQEYGNSLSGSEIQTDNVTEFTAPWNSRKVTAFTQVVERCLGSTHHLIPSGAKTYQSDVESFHRWFGGGLVCGRTVREREGAFEKGGIVSSEFQLQEEKQLQEGYAVEPGAGNLSGVTGRSVGVHSGDP